MPIFYGGEDITKRKEQQQMDNVKIVSEAVQTVEGVYKSHPIGNGKDAFKACLHINRPYTPAGTNHTSDSPSLRTSPCAPPYAPQCQPD